MSKETILDHLDEIRRIDKSNMLSFCVDAGEHYEKAARLAKKVSVDVAKPHSIIISGMGGSAIGGELLKDWARERIMVPVEVCRDYSLPAYAGKDTLVLVVSYSGETEESLSALLDALERRCKIVSVSSGGKLKEFSEKLSIPHVCVPSGMAPRATLPYLFLPLLSILEKMGLVSDVGSGISETIGILKKVSSENSPSRPSNCNFSKTLASAIVDTIPVVYGFGFYRAAAQRFKTQFNENSKVPAKWEFFPELDHNEIVGWERLERLTGSFSIILIRDQDEPTEMSCRIEATKTLIHDSSMKVFEVWSKGRSTLARMCSIICIGDFASVYLAVLRGVDPTPVRTISLLKSRLVQSGLKDNVLRKLQAMTTK